MGHEEAYQRRGHLVEMVKVFIMGTNTPGEPPYSLNHVQVGRVRRQVKDGESSRKSLRQGAHRSLVPTGVIGDHDNFDSRRFRFPCHHKLIEEGRAGIAVERISRPYK